MDKFQTQLMDRITELQVMLKKVIERLEEVERKLSDKPKG